MAAEEERLFPTDAFVSRVADRPSGATELNSIIYTGPVLEEGIIDAILLAEGLRGFGRFVKRVSDLQFEDDDQFILKVHGEPRKGSFEIAVSIARPITDGVRHVADSKFLTGLAIIASLTGLSAKDIGKSLITTFKKRRGRPFESAADIEDLPSDLPIPREKYVRLFNDEEIRAYLRSALRPLRKEGIEEFQTKKDGVLIESVSKSELFAADAAELESLISDEDKTLNIEKVSFLPHLAWHLSDGGKPFDAKIDDEKFWKAIEDGDRFGMGDKIHAHVHTKAEHESDGKLKTTRVITKVHSIERANGQQISLFQRSVDDQA